MKSVYELNPGFGDAENYQRRENKELFERIFVKNEFLDILMKPSTYFLIGEKGTGKTAYAVFMANTRHENTRSSLKYIRETEYDKFVALKRKEHLQLSDYTSIWKVVILLLLAKSVDKEELTNFFDKSRKIQALIQAIDSFYHCAFSPEISTALSFVENSADSAGLVSSTISLKSESGISKAFSEQKFQVNLMYLEQQFKEALSNLKMRDNHFLFIDGIDIRPSTIEYGEYLECVKGLANAIWSLNNDFFPSIRDSRGRFRAILLVRPDIFCAIGLQNMTNKVRDNSAYLDWKTQIPYYRTSHIFSLADRLLSAQQDQSHPSGVCWDHYFPWKSPSSNPARTADDSFADFLKISYCRPRDLVTMVGIMQDEFRQNSRARSEPFCHNDFRSHRFQHSYSEYLMGTIHDQLVFFYNESDYQVFLIFFRFLRGLVEFDYDFYKTAYTAFTEYVCDHHSSIPSHFESEGTFLQFLYDANIINYVEETESQRLVRWCYRERSYSNISPKVAPGLRYQIHQGLKKALNLGAPLRQ